MRKTITALDIEKKYFTTNFVQKYFSEETKGYQILTVLNCVLLHSFQFNILFLKKYTTFLKNIKEQK